MIGLRLGGRPALRHLAPLAAVSTGFALLALGVVAPSAWVLLAALAVIYAMLAVGVSASSAIRQREPRLLATLPIVFFLIHFAYGISSVWGLFRLVVPIPLSVTERVEPTLPPE